MQRGREVDGGHNGQTQRGGEFEKMFKADLPKNDHSPEAVRRFEQRIGAERLKRIVPELIPPINPRPIIDERL